MYTKLPSSPLPHTLTGTFNKLSITDNVCACPKLRRLIVPWSAGGDGPEEADFCRKSFQQVYTNRRICLLRMSSQITMYFVIHGALLTDRKPLNQL